MHKRKFFCKFTYNIITSYKQIDVNTKLGEKKIELKGAILANKPLKKNSVLVYPGVDNFLKTKYTF